MDESLILLLRKGRHEVEALVQQQKNLGVVTQQDADAARLFNYAWQNTTRSLRVAFIETATTMIPTLIQALNAFTNTNEYLQQHKDAIVGTLMAIGAAALYAARGFFTLRRAWLLLIPLAGAVFEDLKAFSEGKNSFTGELLAKSAAARKEYVSWLHLYRDFKKVFNGGNNAFWKAEDSLAGSLRDAQHRSNPNYKPTVANPLTINPEDLENLMPQAKAALGITNAVPIAGHSIVNSQQSSSKNISVNIGDINITAQPTDMQTFTKAINDTLKEQMRQVLYNFDDGILA
jgi:hypothetical protein